MSRWKAASIHLAISVIILAALAVLLSLTWYPPAYLWAAGGLGLIGILAAVDAVIGPLLTLVVYKAGKPGMKFDLACIALLQVLAMGYGLSIMNQARPVYVVFIKDMFELVTAADLPPENLAKASHDEYRELPMTGPRIVAAEMPENEPEREQIMFSAFAGGLDLPSFPQYYLPYENVTETVIQKSKTLDNLLRRDEKTRQILEAYLDDHQLQAEKLKYLPLRAKIKSQTALVDAASAEVVGIVDVSPW